MNKDERINFTKQKFQFFMTNESDADHASDYINSFIKNISTTRQWVISAPLVIDTVEIIEGSPIKIVGGELEIYSALGQELPHDIDTKHFEEVDLIINGLKRLSKNHNIDFEFYLDNTFVGEVISGKSDHVLQLGLIDEWRNHLNQK